MYTPTKNKNDKRFDMYTPDQVEQMIFQYCNERLFISRSLFNEYKGYWGKCSLYSLIGMNSIDILLFLMFIKQAFGVTLGADETYHLSLQGIINKCVTLQKPKPAPKPKVKQAKPKVKRAKPKPVATKPQPAPKPKTTTKPQAEQAKPQPVATTPQVEQAKPQTVAPTPQAEQAKPQPVATKPAEQPQVETKTMAGMMVCKLLGDVCNRRPTGKPNYDAQNWCEFVDCVLFQNFQKLR